MFRKYVGHYVGLAMRRVSSWQIHRLAFDGWWARARLFKNVVERERNVQLNWERL